MMRAAGQVLSAVLLCALGTGSARAEKLLFESYVGNRPAEAARIAPLIRSVFERHGFTADPLVLASYFREHAYRLGAVTPKLADMLRRVEHRAEDDFWDEKYLKVIEDLGSQIAWMRQNPLVFVHEPKHRETALRILAFYALACDRQAQILQADKRPEAAKYEQLRDDTIAEVIRSYPSRVLTVRDFGEAGEKHFLRVRDRLNLSGRGRISVTVADPDGVIYVDEIVHGTGKMDAGDFVPGIYRVLIVIPTGEGRQYEVEVLPNQTSQLVVDWEIDSLLVLEVWAGFRYRTEKEHAREAELVHLLAREHTNVDMAVTVTVTQTHGRISVVGTSYETRTGRLLHSGSVELLGSPSNDAMLNRLATCLTSGECAEGVLPVNHPEYTPPPPDPEPVAPPPVAKPPTALTAAKADRETPPPDWPKWAAAGGSAALFALGGLTLAHRNGLCGWGHPNCKVSPVYDIVGYGAIDAAGALGAISLYGWLDLTPNRLPAKWLVIGGSAAVVAGAVLYAIDQNSEGTDSRGNVTRYYLDSAPGGVALGAAGLAAVGVGVWCWTRGTHVRAIPTVSAGRTGASVGWAGSF